MARSPEILRHILCGCVVAAIVVAARAFGGEFTADGAGAAVVINGDMSWVIKLDAEPIAVQMAVKDVMQDFYKVLGYAPVLLDAPPTKGYYDPSLPVFYLGIPSAQPWLASFDLTSSGCLAGTEAHCLLVTNDAVLGAGTAVVATGNDMRGAIFGIYAFAEEVLGVDPWYLWTDHQPAYVGQVSTPTGTGYPVPAFEFRGWFTNDEDLHGNWKRDPLGATVFDLATFDRFYETLLRLKGNLFLVGTVPLPDEKSIALASRRGLVIIQHHFNLLGLDTFRWPSELGRPGWNWEQNPGYMGYVWQACVAEPRSERDEWGRVAPRGSSARDVMPFDAAAVSDGVGSRVRVSVGVFGTNRSCGRFGCHTPRWDGTAQ